MFKEVIGSCRACGYPIYGPKTLFDKNKLPELVSTCNCRAEREENVRKYEKQQREWDAAARRDAEILHKLDTAARLPLITDHRDLPDD